MRMAALEQPRGEPFTTARLRVGVGQGDGTRPLRPEALTAQRRLGGRRRGHRDTRASA